MNFLNNVKFEAFTLDISADLTPGAMFEYGNPPFNVSSRVRRLSIIYPDGLRGSHEAYTL